MDYNRLERLKLLKFSRLSLICEYEKIESLSKLIEEVSLDTDVLAQVQKDDTAQTENNSSSTEDKKNNDDDVIDAEYVKE